MEIVFFLIALCIWAIYVGIQATRQAFNRELENSTNIEFVLLPKQQWKWVFSFVGVVWTLTFTAMLIGLISSFFE